MASADLPGNLDSTLAVFDETGSPGTPLTTSEVADALDLSRRSTYDRLRALAERDALETKKVGARGRVWWRSVADAGEGSPGGAGSDSPDAVDSPITGVLDEVEVGVFVLDASFEVAWINDAVERYFGLDREAVVGRDKRLLVEETIAGVVDDSATFADTVLATYGEDGDAEEFECRVTPGEGRPERWLEHRSQPIDAGAYAGGRVELYYDVTERKRTERALREEKERFESLVDAAEEYAIFRLDADGCVETWNAGAEHIKGYGREEILGEHVSTFYTAAAREAGVPERNLAAATENGTARDEGWRLRNDGSTFWATVTISAIRDGDGELQGFAKVTRDATDRRERERAVRRERNLLDGILESSPAGIGVFDPDGEVVRINRRFAELLGKSPEEARAYELGEKPLLDADGDPIPFEERPAARTLATGEPTTDWRVRFEPDDGQPRWLSVDTVPVVLEGGRGVVLVCTDVTKLERQARRLERQRDDLESELEDVFERIDDGVFALDRELRFTYANRRASDLLGRSADDLLGEHVWDVFERRSTVDAAFEEALETQMPVSVEEFHDPVGAWFEIHVYPSETGLSVYFSDHTARKERERELELYETIVSTIDDGVYVLDEESRFTMVNDAYVEMTGYDREELLGSHCSIVVDEDVSEEAAEMVEAIAAGDDDSAAIEADIHRGDGSRLRAESNFTALPSEDADRPGVIGVVRDVTDRVERERRLERQREHLTALDDLNGVVRDITEAVVEQSTREEIEAAVCERLAASDSYLFAWIGDVDALSQEVTMRTEAGVEGYLDDITISVDPDDEHDVGPTGRAVLEREVETTRDAQSNRSHDRWREKAEAYGYRSSAAIPILHDGTLYGVLNVYAARPGAFAGDEREVIGQLGEVVGHAIAAIDRKQALMSEEVVELEFQTPGVLDALDVPMDGDGRITFDRAVLAGDGVFLVYGTAADGMLDVADALVEVLPHWDSISVLGEADGTSRFELQLVEPPVLSTVASLGGFLDGAVIEDGDYYMRYHVAPSVDVRSLIDAVQSAYPSARLGTKRQMTRNPGTTGQIDRVLHDELTERQRGALEVAYFSGYFEWPRESTGKDLAASLGVTAPTFHQHLRKAQQGLLQAVYGE